MAEQYVAQTKEHKKDEMEIDLFRLWNAVWRRILIIILVAVVGGAASLLYTIYKVTPLYESSVIFYINNAGPAGDSSGIISPSDLTSSKYLVESYIVVLKTKSTLDEVVKYAGSERTSGEVMGMVKATAVNETELMTVTVTSADPQEAEELANAIAHVVPERIPSIIVGSSAKVVDNAELPTAPSSPSYTTNTLLGVLIALILAVGVVVVKEIFDVSIKDESDVERVCTYPILAIVPDLATTPTGKKNKKKNGSDEWSSYIGPNTDFAAAEAYKLLRTKLEHSFTSEKECRIISVSSATPSEGKSLSSVNLAYSLARLNKRVLLIDCDMRRPTLAEKMNLKTHPGLSDYLIGRMDFQEVCQRYDCGEDYGNFRVVPAGHVPPNPLELLSSEKMAWTMEKLRSHFDYIILDMPPVGEVSDALSIAKQTDGILLVVRQGQCSRAGLKDAVQQFEFVGGKILGVLMNGVQGYRVGYGKKYGYGYGYGYGYRESVYAREARLQAEQNNEA